MIFVRQIFHDNGKTKSWDYIKSEYNLESKLKCCWIQVTDTLPKFWKDRILNCKNFAKLTGKHLSQSIFSTKVAVWRLNILKKNERTKSFADKGYIDGSYISWSNHNLLL